MNNPGLGAIESYDDPRTINYESTLSPLLDKGGIDYYPGDIENQHTVGICTGTSLVQERQKANNKKYSVDFQYLLQKKFFDLNWTEGSSIISALKVGKNIGFLPTDLWTYTTESDRTLPYSQYIAKLKAIPNSEIDRLAGKKNSFGSYVGGLCVDKIPGYSQVDINNPMSIAKSINESESGILCRFAVGKEWFMPSWNPKDINPLKSPVQVISGHAVVMSKFDYTTNTNQVIANTWGSLWCKKGTADVLWDVYRPTEAWAVSDKAFFIKDLYLGIKDPDVRRLQEFLNTHGASIKPDGAAGSSGNETDYFGQKTQQALIKFQVSNNIKPAIGYFGIITRSLVNTML